MEMLHDFPRKQEIDILFLQEVTSPNKGEIHGYRTYTNVGSSMRGTAFVTRDEILLTVNKHPMGRGMASDIRGVTLNDIYTHPPERHRRGK